MRAVLRPTTSTGEKLKRYGGGQSCHIWEGVKFLSFKWVDLHKTILVSKSHRNLSNIERVMALCANWHSCGLKGLEMSQMIKNGNLHSPMGCERTSEYMYM